MCGSTDEVDTMAIVSLVVDAVVVLLPDRPVDTEGGNSSRVLPLVLTRYQVVTAAQYGVRPVVSGVEYPRKAQSQYHFPTIFPPSVPPFSNLKGIFSQSVPALFHFGTANYLG
jgi:hypothetical protein